MRTHLSYDQDLARMRFKSVLLLLFEPAEELRMIKAMIPRVDVAILADRTR